MTGRTGRLCVFVLAVAVSIVAGCATPQGDTLNQQRYDARLMKRDTLATMKQRYPDLAAQAYAAPGMGVFESFGTTVGAIGGANGYGIVTDASGRDHYMRFAGLKLGLGLGGKVYRTVLVFNDADALASFVTGGWNAGGEAEATAKNASRGGQHRAATDFRAIEAYQVTDAGFIAEAVIEGARFWRDGDLNVD